MIPIRNFPYTDYHDLNLDWLLRQMQIWEIDLEELKRRVKALEDWRTDTVDPDLHDIKITIIDIQNDIRDLGDRVTIVEGDIVTIKGNVNTLAGNNKVIAVKWDNSDIHFYDVTSGFPGDEITDKHAFLLELRQTRASALGTKNYEIVYYQSSGLSSVDYMIQDLFPDHRQLACKFVVYDGNINVDYCGFTILTDNTYLSYGRTTSSGKLVNVSQFGSFSSSSTFETNTDASTASEYPYYVRNSINGITEDTRIEAFFRTLKDNLTYSDVVSDFIRTGTDYYDVFFKRTLVSPESFILDLNVIGGI